MICLFSSIKEIFTGQPLIPFQGGACKARKSVIIDPYTCLPDSNNMFYVSRMIVLLFTVSISRMLLAQGNNTGMGGDELGGYSSLAERIFKLENNQNAFNVYLNFSSAGFVGFDEVKKSLL